MRLKTITPTTGGLWMSRPVAPAGQRPLPYKPFFLWALTDKDDQVVPYDPVAGECLFDHEILSPIDDPIALVDALDEAEEPFA